jgi:hypothetical protein
LTWVVLLTENGDLPDGALSASGIPVLSLRIEVALSVLVFPEEEVPAGRRVGEPRRADD